MWGGLCSIIASSELSKRSIWSTIISYWHPLMFLSMSRPFRHHLSTMASSVLSSFLVSDRMVQVPSATMSSCQRQNFLSLFLTHLYYMTFLGTGSFSLGFRDIFQGQFRPLAPDTPHSSLFLYCEVKRISSSFFPQDSQ